MSSMSSYPSTYPVERGRGASRFWRVGLAALLLIALLAAGTAVWFYTAAHWALPQLDGTVVTPGLKAPVSVVRDRHGVPSITAQSLDDLFFAQGFVTAQDRLWQMDMMRRYASGELSAALGSRYVEVDREQRVLGLREVARRSVAQSSPEVRAQLDAYARGVNAYIAGHRFGLPLEMRVLRYFPRAWTAEDSALVGASMAEMLNHGVYLDELHREKILQRLGPELTADLYPERSQRDIMPGHDLDDSEPSTQAGAQKQIQEQEQKQDTLPEPMQVHTQRHHRVRESSRHMRDSSPPPRPHHIRQTKADVGHPRGKRVSSAHVRSTHVRRRRRAGVEDAPDASAPDASSSPKSLRAGSADWSGAGVLRFAQDDTSKQDRDQRQEQQQLPHPSLTAGPGWGTRNSAEQLVEARAWEFVQDLRRGGMDAVAPGSNEWVIGGAHTASGRPLLSNDMHLPPHIPNTWYEAHLTCGDYDVAGVTLPGAPWIIVGHNRRIAWGFTSLMDDVEDVYVENINAAGEYETPTGWRKPEVRHEVIHVKRGRDVAMDVVVTRHGPIVSDSIPGEPRKLALKWALLDSGLTMPFYALNNAQNWEQFRAALAGFNAPGQNVVYADVDGNIGYQATGQVPLRASGDGTLPVSGADDAHEWTGYVPFEEMPSAYNPPSGILATANGRVTQDSYKYQLSEEWESPYRTERIYRVLRQSKKFTAADMLALQNDVQSDLDKFVAQRMVYAVDQTPGASPRVRSAAEILRRFNGELSVDSAGAAIEQRARAWLMETLLASKLGGDAKLYHWYMNTVWLENVVAFQPARWLPQQYASWDALLEAAVEAAANSPDAPRDLASWKYGDYAKVEIAHPIFGNLPWLRKYASTGRWPQSGNGITVKQVGGLFAPSERFTADFGDLNHSTLNIVNGQSGNLFSPYFNDQFQAWYQGTTFELPFAPETVERTAAHRLRMVGE